MGQKYSLNKDEFAPNSSDIDKNETKIGDENQSTKYPAVNNSYRDVILDCFGKASDATAMRIMTRIVQQRADFRQYKDGLSTEKWQNMATLLGIYLKNTIDNIGDIEKVKKLSMEYGATQVLFKPGFKADFFAPMADAIATECAFLSESATVHAPAHTFKAWTLLVELMFSSVRDGYYSELRKIRRQSPSHLAYSKEGSADEDINSRDCSVNPTDSDITKSAEYLEKDFQQRSEDKYFSQSMSDVSLQNTDLVKREGTLKIRQRALPFIRSQSSTIFTNSDLPPRRLTNEYQDIHRERLKQAIKSHSRTETEAETCTVGRYIKNPAALVDHERRRQHLMEGISKRSNHRKYSPSSTINQKTFDPNQIIDDFVNNRLC